MTAGERLTVQFAGLILINAVCLVIAVQAESLETLLLAHAASAVASGRLTGRTRSGPESSRDSVKRQYSRLLFDQFQSRCTVGLVSLICTATGFVFLGSLAGSSSLEVIETTLRESYRPERSDLLVGYGSVLGIAAAVLLFAGVAVSFGMFPMHGLLMNGFESSSATTAGMTAVLQRLQAGVVIWKVAVTAMPGFEATIVVLCMVFGAVSCFAGSILACRHESLRGLAGCLWITWGGVELIAIGTELMVEAPSGREATWQFPAGLEAATFSFLISSIAMSVLIFNEYWLHREDRSVDFAEDLTGLGRQHRALASSIGCSLLTLSAVPPLPGFWSAVFILGNAFLPGVESTHGAALVPDSSILFAAALMMISLLLVGARSVHFLSLMFLQEPIRRFDVAGRWVPHWIGAFLLGLLLWTGLNGGTVIAWIHHLPF